MPSGEHNAQKTHCPSGHRYSEENTYVRKDGARVCKECLRVYKREYMRRRRGTIVHRVFP